MKKFKPATPSRRQMTVVDFSSLSDVRPLKRLTVRLKSRAGRNSQGRITMRHQGGGHKKLYRLVDFKQKPGFTARVEAIEYDPYRTAFITRLVHENGKRSYVIAWADVHVGDRVVIAPEAPPTAGNRLKLKNIPVGYQVFNIELSPGRGGQMARSAGSYAEVSAQEGKYTHLKLPSGEVRKALADGFATIGRASNPENNLVVLGNAGRSRHLGIRPTVRGSAMNPVDHPYGGGEGQTQRGTKRPKDIWGNITGGRRTRRKKKSSSALVVSPRRRHK